MTLRLGPEVQDDISGAARWYESRETALGTVLIEEIDAAFGRIEANPAQYPISYRGLRRALVRRFPYAIYFKHAQDDILIVAVLHQRRDRQLIDER